MIRFKHILILFCLSRALCQSSPTDLPQNKQCDRYKVFANVTVDPDMCVKPEFKTDKRNSMVCVQNCNDMKLCTAVLVNTTGSTSRCCYLTKNPVGVAPGGNTLYLKRDVTTTCMFGFKPTTECNECLQGYRLANVYTSGESSKSLELNLNFSGRLCSDITGNVIVTTNDSSEENVVKGTINRSSGIWNLTDSTNHLAYRVKLVDGTIAIT